MKRILLSGILLFSITYANAQQRKVFIKPICSIDYNSLNWDNAPVKRKQVKYHVGYSLGILGELKISDKWGLETGAIYRYKKSEISRGLKPDRTTTNFGMIENTKYHFIDLPLNVLFKQASEAPFYVGIGLAASYNISSKRTADDMENPDTRLFEDDFSLKTMKGNSLSTSGNLFVGKDWKISKVGLGARIQYTIPFSDWQYPTYYDTEDKTGYPMRFSSLSLNVVATF